MASHFVRLAWICICLLVFRNNRSRSLLHRLQDYGYLHRDNLSLRCTHSSQTKQKNSYFLRDTQGCHTNVFAGLDTAFLVPLWFGVIFTSTTFLGPQLGMGIYLARDWPTVQHGIRDMYIFLLSVFATLLAWEVSSINHLLWLQGWWLFVLLIGHHTNYMHYTLISCKRMKYMYDGKPRRLF